MSLKTFDIYNRNGVVIRQTNLTDEIVEVELEFLDATRRHTALYSLAAAYLSFVERLQINFVVSSHRMCQFTLLASDFNRHAKLTLIEAVLETRNNAAKLFRCAEEYFSGDDSIVATNTSGILDPYKKTDFIGRKFVEAFARALKENAPSPNP